MPAFLDLIIMKKNCPIERVALWILRLISIIILLIAIYLWARN